MFLYLLNNETLWFFYLFINMLNEIFYAWSFKLLFVWTIKFKLYSYNNFQLYQTSRKSKVMEMTLYSFKKRWFKGYFYKVL